MRAIIIVVVVVIIIIIRLNAMANPGITFFVQTNPAAINKIKY